MEKLNNLPRLWNYIWNRWDLKTGNLTFEYVLLIFLDYFLPNDENSAQCYTI